MLRASLLVFVAALAASPTLAKPRYLTMVRVEVGDLDLRSDAGAAVMFRRLDVAARDLCAMTRSPLFPGHEGRAWRCRREALAAAVQRLNAPKITLAYSDWLSADPTAVPPSPRPR